MSKVKITDSEYSPEFEQSIKNMPKDIADKVDAQLFEAAKRIQAIEFGNWLSYNKKWFCGEYDEDGRAIFRYTEDMYERFLAQKRGEK